MKLIGGLVVITMVIRWRIVLLLLLEEQRPRNLLLMARMVVHQKWKQIWMKVMVIYSVLLLLWWVPCILSIMMNCLVDESCLLFNSIQARELEIYSSIFHVFRSVSENEFNWSPYTVCIFSRGYVYMVKSFYIIFFLIYSCLHNELLKGCISELLNMLYSKVLENVA